MSEERKTIASVVISSQTSNKKAKKLYTSLAMILLIAIIAISAATAPAKENEETPPSNFDNLSTRQITGMLLYAPLFDKLSPVSDFTMCELLRIGLLDEYWIDGSSSTPFSDIACTRSSVTIDDSSIPCISCDLKEAQNLAKMLGYEREIDGSLLQEVYSEDYDGFSIADGKLKLLVEVYSSPLPDYDLQILDTKQNEDTLIVEYTLDQDLYGNNIISENPRRMTFRYIDGEYTVESNVVYAER